MEFISTRGSRPVTGEEAVLKGIAEDGGLYVPSSFPELTREEMENMLWMDYSERAACILCKFFDEIPEAEMKSYTDRAYSRFTDCEPAPVIDIDGESYIMELFHGPTLAFKDVALTLLPHLMTAARKKFSNGEKTLILVATSGDTGKAALEGFKDVEGTEIIVFYPSEGVSELQKLQMQTTTGSNTHVVGIKGNFDDAQTGVKRIFTDPDYIARFKEMGYSLSSANSINWGRLAPQIVYYVSAYLDLVGAEQIDMYDKINFVVPTGNFGNILAAYYAYEVQLFQACPGELRDLYSDLRGRTLDAGILEDIRSELPRRRDIADGWGERDLPALFPRICAGARTLPGRELVRRIKLNELFQSRDQVHAFVDQAGRRTSCLLHGTPENIAGFLAGHALADRVTLTDASYELVLSASGSVIDQCPDKALLDEVTRALLPIQRGETAPAPIFSPTMAEMALWLQSEQGQGQGRMVQMM